jgi:iron complex outermembrane receptor protein
MIRAQLAKTDHRGGFMSRRSFDSLARARRLAAPTRVAAAVAAALSTCYPAVSLAQQASAPGEAEKSDQALQEITVTGSRIVRRDLDASTPVVTVEREAFQNSAYTSVDQVLNELPQFVVGAINGVTAGVSGEFATADVQPSATNSPGAATINLRGLGTNRSLTLIDGRRGQPSNASLAIDLNTIPSSAIASVEVITGGASAVYGADALGGVTNFKLRDNFQGVELTARGGVNEAGGDGKDWQLSALVGTALSDKGSAMVSMEWYRRESALVHNRDWLTDQWADSTNGGTQIRLNFPSVEFGGATVTAGPSSTTSGIVTGNRPSQAALNAAFPGRPGDIPTNSTVYFNHDNSFFLQGGANIPVPGGLGFNSAPLDGRPYKVFNNYDSAGGVTGTSMGENDPDEWLTSPMERFSFFGRAKYDITERVQAYTQVSFVASSVDQRLQPTGAVGNFSAAIPRGDQVYLPSVQQTATPTVPAGATRPEYRAGGSLGLNCPATGGCTLTQAFPVPAQLAALLDSRAASPNCVVRTSNGTTSTNAQNPLTGTDLQTCGPNSAWRLGQTLDFLPTRGTVNEQRLYQMIGGMQGELGLGDWTWDAYFSHGDTLLEASYVGYPSTEQYRAIVQAPNFGRNYSSPIYLNSKSASCTSGLPIFEDFQVSQDCIDAILTDSTDRSSLRQDIYEANFQGGIFDLPAGQVRSSVGLSYRANDYIFRPDPIRATNYIQDAGVGQFGAVTSGGETRVREVYGEMLVPVLRDLPGIRRLELELGYRYSMYDSGAGDVPTWKALMTWSPLDWINVRGGYQKANRAPNIAELYLGETSIVTVGADPCRTNNTVQQEWYNNASNPNRAQLQALCSALIGNPASDFDVNPNTFGGGGGLQVQLGNPELKSEAGETWTIGTVFRSPFDHALARSITASVDYYKAEIEDNIGAFTMQEVLDTCFNRYGDNPTFSLDEPTGSCARIQRDNFSGNLSRVQTPYANRGGIETSGMDLSLNWTAGLEDMGLGVPGRLSFGTQATRVFHYISQATEISTPVENVGYSNLPKWRTTTRLSYFVQSFSAGINWRYQSEVMPGAAQTNPDTLTIGGPSYSRFDGNMGYQIGQLDLRLSVSNLFNKEPPPYSYSPWTTGSNTNLAAADLVGRRYTLTASMSF